MRNKLKEYKARLEFWWARKSLKDGRDFALSFDELGMVVTILKGPFEKVEYRYSPIQVREDDEGVVDFHTVIRYNPLNADVTDPRFVSLTTNILRIVLHEATVGGNELKVNEQVNDENRDTDTGELDQERGIREEVSPLLEKRVSKRKSSRKKTVRTDSEVHPEIQQPAKPKRTRARTTGKKRPHGK